MPTWIQLARDGVSPIAAAKLMSCSVGAAVRRICKAKHQMGRPLSERIPTLEAMQFAAVEGEVVLAIVPDASLSFGTKKTSGDVGNIRAPQRTAITPSCNLTVQQMEGMTTAKPYYVDRRQAPARIRDAV